MEFKKKVIDECQDLKKLALETIESFKIKIAEIDIERVIKKYFQLNEKMEVRETRQSSQFTLKILRLS